MKGDEKSLVVVLLMLVMSVTACSRSDGSADNGTQSTSSGDMLQITGQPATQISAGDGYYFNAESSGGAGSTYAFAIKNKPVWISFNTLTGELKGSTSSAGTYADITLSVSDGKSTASLKPFTITVVGNAGKVKLSWSGPSQNTDGTQLKDLSGYTIRYGTSASNLTQRVAIGSPSIVSYTLDNLSKGRTYYFTVSAVNGQDVEGEASKVISVAI